MLSRPKGKRKIELFYSYSHEDDDLRNGLEKHLRILKKQRIINDWHDRKITAGQDWGGEIDKHLNAAQIILLLVSANFLASDYCYDVEVKMAMEKHKKGESKIIPVILRDVDWRNSLFGKLQPLPVDGKAVTRWRNKDAAFANIAAGIRKVLEEFEVTKSSIRKVVGQRRKKKKIIIFEDDKLWMERIRSVLKSQNFEMEAYRHYSEKLLSRLAVDDYDLLVTDINLNNSEPSKDGTVVVEYARACKKKLPIVVITGYAFDDVLEVIDHLVEAKIDHFIAKSKYDPAKFLKVVLRLLRRGRK